MCYPGCNDSVRVELECADKEVHYLVCDRNLEVVFPSLGVVSQAELDPELAHRIEKVTAELIKGFLAGMARRNRTKKIAIACVSSLLLTALAFAGFFLLTSRDHSEVLTEVSNLSVTDNPPSGWPLDTLGPDATLLHPLDLSYTRCIGLKPCYPPTERHPSGQAHSRVSSTLARLLMPYNR